MAKEEFDKLPMKINDYFLPTQESIKIVTVDYNTVYLMVLAHEIDISNVYRGDLGRAYDDYHHGHIVPLEGGRECGAIGFT